MYRRFFISIGAAALLGLSGCLGSEDADTPTSTGESDTPGTDHPTSAEPSPTSTVDAAPREATPPPGRDASPTPTPTERLEGPRNGDDLPEDPDPDDGYPPAFDRQPAARSFDVEAFETLSVDPDYLAGGEDVAVPLAPIEATYYWYARGEARFVDARVESQYELARVYGAVENYALDDLDPAIEAWPSGDRIVCYCGCPHSLSSIRAATLLEAGFEEVYALDDGFQEWFTRDYPMAGSHVEERPAEYLIEGVTDPASAGDDASVAHEPTGQSNTGPIEPDGSYAVGVNFDGITIDSVLAVETPDYRVETTLGDALGDVVEPPSG